ncbi:MAG: hypothetical protein NNA19_01645 [Nitrospira sp.]|nr:hypothetical protein [Nitrospira sp.]MCP9473939.1 hypothetical protein [Nitrospira sp.]
MGGNKRIGAALVNHAAFSATPDTVAGDISHREQVSNQGRDLIALVVGHTDVMWKGINTLQRQTANLRRTRDLLLQRLLLRQIPLAERMV